VRNRELLWLRPRSESRRAQNGSALQATATKLPGNPELTAEGIASPRQLTPLVKGYARRKEKCGCFLFELDIRGQDRPRVRYEHEIPALFGMKIRDDVAQSPPDSVPVNCLTQFPADIESETITAETIG
jgi:hypothetical protein